MKTRTWWQSRKECRGEDSSRRMDPGLEQLEPRLLLSSDPVGLAALEPVMDPFYSQPQAVIETQLTPGEGRIIEDERQGAKGGPNPYELAPIDLFLDIDSCEGVALSDTDSEDRKDIESEADISVDSSFKNDFLFENASESDVVIRVIPADTNGIQYVTGVLAQYRDVDAIHIISHGAPGAVTLGTGELTADSPGSYTDDLRAWANALAADADGPMAASGLEGMILLWTAAHEPGHAQGLGHDNLCVII